MTRRHTAYSVNFPILTLFKSHWQTKHKNEVRVQELMKLSLSARTEWQLGTDKVMMNVSDNGSNTVKATQFRLQPTVEEVSVNQAAVVRAQ